MKKSLKVVTVVLAIVAIATLFGACSGKKPSGTYESLISTVEFSGSKLTMLGVSSKFKMKGDKIIVDGEQVGTYDSKNDTVTMSGNDLH